MKKLILLLIIYSGCRQGFSQVLVTSGASITTRNGGTIVFNNVDLLNNGSIQHGPGDGVLKFTGNSGDTISGIGVNSYDRLLIAKSSGSRVYLKSDVKIGGQVQFSSGILDLQNNKLDLGSTGMLTNESEVSRAFTSGKGYIETIQNFNQPTSADPANIGVLLTSPYNLGSTIVQRRHDVQTVYNTNSSILRYFDVIPTNNTSLKATLRFKYFDAELNNLSEGTLSQWKCNFNNTWALAGADLKDTSANYVEKAHNGKLMRYTLSTAIPPSITCPNNISINGTNTCTASISFTGNYAATATGIPQPTITYQIGATPIGNMYTFPIGTTTVTAIASDGVNANVSCTFKVSVYETAPPLITSCPLSNTLCYNTSNTYTLPTLTATDNCSTVSVTYNISGATTRSGTGNDASGLYNPGTSAINWLVTDASGNVSACTTTITVVTKGKCTVVNPTARAIQVTPAVVDGPLLLKALPNPTSTSFKVYILGSPVEQTDIRIVDLLGRLIESKQNISNGSYLDVGQKYAPGVYILEAFQGNKTATIKLIKQPE
jgi:hypothetical protein